MERIISVLAGSLTIILTFVILVKCAGREPTPPQLPTRPNNPPIAVPEPVQPSIKPIKSELKWHTYPATGKGQYRGKVLTDIENHMDYSQVPFGHGIYRDSDPVTWGHETTHGINGVLRNLYGYAQDSECLYCLNSRFVMIKEPNISRNIAQYHVPRSLRGRSTTVFGTLLRGYNVLYVLDEWVCYTNGSEVKLDLRLTNRGGTVQYMTKHMIFTLATAKAIRERDPSYDDTQLKAFVKWNIERNFRILDQDKSGEGGAYLETFRTSADAAKLRMFTQNWLGRDFTQKYFGF